MAHVPLPPTPGSGVASGYGSDGVARAGAAPAAGYAGGSGVRGADAAPGNSARADLGKPGLLRAVARRADRSAFAAWAPYVVGVTLVIERLDAWVGLSWVRGVLAMMLLAVVVGTTLALLFPLWLWLLVVVGGTWGRSVRAWRRRPRH